ncbi:hypothetical protein BKA80DRAFT_100337 [Phyllosticta citrichinensis]
MICVVSLSPLTSLTSLAPERLLRPQRRQDMMEEIVIRFDGPRKRHGAGEVHVGPRVGWQIQQRNLRLGASVPIGMHDNRLLLLLLLPLPSSTPARLSSPTSFLSFPLPSAVVHSTCEHLQSPASLSQPDCFAIHSFSTTTTLSTVHSSARRPEKLLAPVRYALRPSPRPPRLLARRIAHDLPRHFRLKHASSNTLRPSSSAPCALVLALGDTGPPNNTSLPPLVSPWPTRLWSAVAAISTSRPP